MKNTKLVWSIIVVIGVIAAVLLFTHNKAVAPAQESVMATSTNIADWKTYNDIKNGYSFNYPSLLTPFQNGGTVMLSHSVAFTHPDPCDAKGDAAPLDKLIDFRATFHVFNQNLKTVVQSSTYPDWDYVFKNPFTLGSLSGYKIQSGVEGCGENLYYFMLSPDKTLVVREQLITELNPIVSEYKSNLKLPGIITPDQEQELITKIISSFKITSPTASTETHKTYMDSKYGFSLEYPDIWTTTGLKTSSMGGFDYINFGPTNMLENTPLTKIQIYPNATTLTNFIKIHSGLIGTWSDTTVAGIPAKSFDNIQNNRGIRLFMFVKDGYGFEIGSTNAGQDSAIATEMANSFKFLPEQI